MVATQKGKKRSKLTETVPNPGPGLFIDERARGSLARAYIAIRRSLRVEPHRELGITWANARPLVMPALREIARWYWADRDYDDRTTLADMKPEVRRLRQRLRRLQAEVDGLSRSVVHALNMQMSRRAGVGPLVTDNLAALRGAHDALDQACEPILDRKNKKSRSISVEKACAALWQLWETVTGRPFVRQWATAKTPARFAATRGSREFVGSDALFVQIVLRAIDPVVTIQMLRNGLKRVAMRRPKSG